MRGLKYILALTSALSFASMACAADAPPGSDNNRDGLSDLSLQQLGDIEVTSVSKRVEKASQAAAAIYVITQDDIRRSGLQSVPELLRLVPGLQVAQSGSQNWAVTSRGFNGEFAKDLLVLIDGRTVFSPVFSGMFWDAQSVMLEDIDRIEVIRGPGATLWGANAVNGVINIITKSAKDTQGTLVTAATGNHERVSTAARYGGSEGNLAYRTYAQYFNNNQEQLASNPALGIQGGGAEDQWHNMQGGFRLDWSQSDKEQQTLQGDVYHGSENALRFLPVTTPNLLRVVDDTDDISGINVLGRWTHEFAQGSDVTLQTYYDDVTREFTDAATGLHTQTYDVDFQHNLTLGSRNEVTWGLGYRAINSGYENSFYLAYSPEDLNENLFSGFLQDKLALVPNRLYLTFGSKLEHNDFSGFEYEPSIRLAWTPTSTQTLWTAVSRAVRAPTQSDQNISQFVVGVAPTSPTTVFTQQGLSSASAEIVDAYEIGYRIQPVSNVSIDATAFVNEYHSLDSSTPGTPALVTDPLMGTYVKYPFYSTNLNSGETHGFELASEWKVTSHVKLSGGYTLYYEALHIVDSGASTANGTAPNHQFNIRSFVDLPHDVEWDTMLYYVDRVPGVSDGFGGQEMIPAYTRLDMRLGWKPFSGLDLSLIGQNLLQSEHIEYSPFLYQTTEQIGRSVLAKASLKF